MSIFVPVKASMRDNMRPPERIDILPPEWREIPSPLPDSRAYNARNGLMSVIISEERHADGKWWVHLSAAHVHRYPTWDELRAIKNIFLGRQRRVLQILPPEAEYVNIHENCFHLWTTVQGDPLPDGP